MLLLMLILPSHFAMTPDALVAAAMARWQELVGLNAPRPSDPCKQKQWDTPCCTAVADDLLTRNSDQASRARLLASRACGSGEWLHALPLASIGLKLDDTCTRIAVSLRLGVSAVLPHTCECGAPVLCNGHHGLSCRKSADRQQRHASVNDIIHRALHSAGIQANREPVGLCGVGDDRRPDGITLVPWSRGKQLVWDFTCPDTLAPSHLVATSATVAAAAESAEQLKRTKYSDLCAIFEFVPVAVETLGVWGRSAWEFTGLLGKRIAAATKDPRSTSFLRQRISIAVQRGNGLAVLGTHRHINPPKLCVIA